MAKNLAISSLSGRSAAVSVRRHWLMEEAQRFEIAARLRDLRDNSVETNDSIAEAVGVKERTVAGWASPTKPQGMTYAHAKAIAKLFGEDLDWFWRGKPRGETPDVLSALSNGSVAQLDRIEREVGQLAAALAELAAAVGALQKSQARPKRRAAQRTGS